MSERIPPLELCQRISEFYSIQQVVLQNDLCEATILYTLYNSGLFDPYEYVYPNGDFIEDED